MAQHSLIQVVERASADAAFRAQLQRSPENALAGYDLTGAERAALLSGDPEQLTELGVDARISKIDGWPTTPTGGEGLGTGIGGFGS